MMTELEYVQEQIALTRALLELGILQERHDKLFGEGSYRRAVLAVQKSLFPTESLPTQD